MAILYESGKKTFTLQTQNTTYQMKIAQYGYVVHTYYGPKAEDEDFSYLIRHYDRGFSPNPYEAGNDRTFSLDVLPQEFSSCGVGDFRISGIEVKNHDGSIAFCGTYAGHRIYPGKYGLEGMPSLRVREEDHVDTLELVLRDAVTGVEAVLLYGVFEEKDIITRTVRIENHGDQAVQLEKIMSAVLDFMDSDYDWISFNGRHAMERGMQRIPLSFGVQSFGSIRGTSSHQHNPFAVLCEKNACEDYGNCYGFSFMYSGDFFCGAQKDPFEQTRVVMGIHPEHFSWSVKPGEVFQAPEMVLAFSEHGFTGLTHLYHDIYRRNLCDSIYMEKRRPVLLNSWEAAYFDFNYESLIEIAKASSEIGADLFVLDDGWFGERNSDDAALGDWQVNEKKLPGGLKRLSEEIKRLGMDFGLWVEPEMVSEDSRLYRQHPDWCLHMQGRPSARGRYQLVLDLSRKEVQDFVLDFMRNILDESDITYIKWDMNRSLCNIGSAAAKEQGEVAHRYMLGVYRILEELTKEYPQVLFEGCSGGGGRFDAAMLYYHPQIWCSDNTDAINRLKIQYGTSFGYPVSAMGAHVSVCPNHQTGRTVPLKTRGIVAMSGTFGYELDASRLDEEEKRQCREMTEDFRRFQELIFQGDYYRLTSPYENRAFTAWAFVAKDKKSCLANLVITDCESNDAQRYMRLRGLEKRQRYRIEGMEGSYSGQALMQAGIPVPCGMKEYDAAWYYLTAEEI